MIKIIKVNPEPKNAATEEGMARENYAHYFWVWFGIFFALGVAMIMVTKYGKSLPILRLVVVGMILIVSIFCSVATYRALQFVGKKFGWVLGLVPLVNPFGFVVSFLIIRSKLKSNGTWDQGQKDKKIPWILKVFGIIALIIIAIFWMLLRGERITRYTREAVEKAKIEEVSN